MISENTIIEIKFILAMTFPTIEVATIMVKSQAGVGANDFTRDDYIARILESSKGIIDDGQTIVSEYRPYLVAALTMATSKGEQTIHEATGDAKFRYEKDRVNLRPPIEWNLITQQSLDSSQGTQVPTGWDVQTYLDRLCGCEGPGQAVGGGYPYSAMVAGR